MHFCSSTYKDAVQLRKRFQRIAKNTAREFDEITEEGTLIYGGVIDGGGDQALAEEILTEADVPEELFEVNEGKIELAWWVLEDLKDGLKEELEPSGTKIFIVERHPFEDGMLVELIPL